MNVREDNIDVQMKVRKHKRDEREMKVRKDKRDESEKGKER